MNNRTQSTPDNLTNKKTNKNNATITVAAAMAEEEQESSGDEFPEITEEEIETWSSVERKRFHFKTSALRDEHLLRQALTVKPFESTTKNERFDKWELVALACDEMIKQLPENASGQLNFYTGKHAKRRFKVLMEAHYGLLNDNRNPMFFGIYGEYGNIQALIERAYKLYLLAGYKPGQNAGFFKKKRHQRNGSNQNNAKRLRTNNINDESDVDPLQMMQNKLDAHSFKSLESQQQLLKEIQNAFSQMREDNKRIQTALDKREEDAREQLAEHKIEIEKITKENQEKLTEMENFMMKCNAAEKARQEQWKEMCEHWMKQQHDTLMIQKEMIAMQSETEESRMTLLRELFEDKRQN
ncbi:hypothetical protein BDA99DRAFT_71326 [Phascolomyces articulosus]|uniref:Uncharacterized protein n=1 Tax=Phascolomyces articulosus TaxID=60185 RepID=A0AAD5JZI2_9FUNG|nr:hypothetical protein BDA99DRAFT_71326 [Phascolomyces articulosus]